MKATKGKAALLALLFAASATIGRASIPQGQELARDLERSLEQRPNPLDAALDQVADAQLDAHALRFPLQLDRHFDFALELQIELAGEPVNDGACAELAENSRPGLGLRNAGLQPGVLRRNPVWGRTGRKVELVLLPRHRLTVRGSARPEGILIQASREMGK